MQCPVRPYWTVPYQLKDCLKSQPLFRIFAKAGYNVALVARNADSLEKLAEEIQGTGGEPFLELTAEEIQESVNTNIIAAFAFAREAITLFKGLELDDKGKRGTLLFTGATASLRGNTTTSAIAAGKFGVRALSQSLAKEFGKENIHVAHAIIDGGILTGRARSYVPQEKLENPDALLNPESIGNSYLYLVNQDRSAWTWELDLRPAHEKW
ncbi:hypothetical protein HWV62_12679 [Athelia sp. TMB]|nr:hypothetical protein HWV62_12679 [Athelia sp. TMB]